MDKDTRNSLRITVTQCRRLLEEAIAARLEGEYGIHSTGHIEADVHLSHLSAQDQAYRSQLRVHLDHIIAGGYKAKEAIAQLVREVAFTHLNRLVAYKLMERRGLIREAVSRGVKSQGFLFYLADHPDDEKLWSGGQPDVAYRHYLEWLGRSLAEEIRPLFAQHDPANRLFPPQRSLDAVLDQLNAPQLADIWDEDETIGWVYQYFTPDELRREARNQSSAPRNSYELAFRNQFYTPRYVVEFLSDNTLGRIWYEMRQGQTRLADQCRYLVRRPHEIFLSDPDQYLNRNVRPWVRQARQGDFTDLPDDPSEDELTSLSLAFNGYEVAEKVGGYGEDLLAWANRQIDRFSQGGSLPTNTLDLWLLLFALQRSHRAMIGSAPAPRDFLDLWRTSYLAWRSSVQDESPTVDRQTSVIFVPYRRKKDPRQLKILDPAGGSGHFLLYCFDLLLTIYEEAYTDPELGSRLQADYPSLADLQRALPGLILRHNLHLIDIDRRATQIAALALWLRAQRAYRELGLQREERPAIRKANIVCAEPMPGNKKLLDEFIADLRPPLLGQLVRVIFDKMKLAGEAGSLLKIEVELREAIGEARRQWLAEPKPQQLTLFGTEPQPEQMALHFDLSGITDAEFWDRIEGLVLRALADYASKVANGQGLARQLFAEDTAQGFAFIDVCQNRFDVVLMNPPFGEPSVDTRDFIKEHYFRESVNLLSAFIQRAKLFCTTGYIGAITDSTWLKKASYTELRSDLIQTECLPDLISDLGWGVLDEANVATCSFIISLSQKVKKESVVFRLVEFNLQEKDAVLRTAIEAVHGLKSVTAPVFIRSWYFFKQFPNQSLAYETSDDLVTAFESWSKLSSYATARRGYTPGDTFRFFRCWWEVPILSRGNTWKTLNNGGSYSPVLGQGFFVSLYEEDWKSYRKLAGFRLESEDWFGKAGIGYGKRTDFMYAYPFPASSMFSMEGNCIFPPESHYWSLLAYLNSSVCQALINLYCGQHKTPGYVSQVPTPDPRHQMMSEAGAIAKELYYRGQAIQQRDETLEQFIFFMTKNESFSTLGNGINKFDNWYKTKLSQIDTKILTIIGLDGDKLERVREILSYGRPAPQVTAVAPFTQNVVQGKAYPIDLIQYCIGVIIGRWDVRYAMGERKSTDVPEAFASLPICPPGMLQDDIGLPAFQTPEGYPTVVDWDGILVDDPDDPDDIVRRVRGVLEIIWGEHAIVIEQKACDILGVAILSDYFRKAGPGGFWMDHVKRYTKSRRKAPIYWLLQSNKGNYALWLYYHRLDKDILYKALVNYVEPKIRLEENKLTHLQAQRTTFGTGGREAKQLERQLERQEAFLSELRDFQDKLRRAAQLNLIPDLNDGVILNIAPLHELVPWKDAQTTWQELLAGKYEWSSISRQLLAKK
jgi:hypothetical protein